jgi:hypothetical protein
VTETDKSVKAQQITTIQPSSGFGPDGVYPGRPKTAGSHAGGRKEIDRPAAMEHLFA